MAKIGLVGALFLLMVTSCDKGCSLDDLLGELGLYPEDMDGVYWGTLKYDAGRSASFIDMEALGDNVTLVERKGPAERVFSGEYEYDGSRGEFNATLVYEEEPAPGSADGPGYRVPSTLEMNGRFGIDSVVITGDFTLYYDDGSSASGTWLSQQETGH